MVVDVFPSMDSSLMMKTLLRNTLVLAFCPWYVFAVSTFVILGNMKMETANGMTTQG